jgi:SP family galactose:H+ symporter-like MFS transporter
MEHARLMKNKAKANGKRFVYIAVGVAALGGLLFGFDTGVISGAILFIKEQFSLSTTMEEIVVSAVLIGAVTGAIIGGTLTDRFGRRRLIMLAGIIFTVSSIATALAQTVTVLITGRIVVGIAIGIASFISPLYIAELVPAKVRGALVAVNMLAITTGIVVAYVVDYALSGIQGWRYMFGVAVIPSIILAVAMWRLPDSPRWLISRSKVEQARQVLQRVRIVSDVSPEISEIQQSLAEQKGSGVTELFRPSLRMPLIVGVGLAIFQQITGINTVIYYAPTIFGFAGFETAGSAILAGAGLGILMLCIHVLAIYLMDRVGRRPLLLIGVAGQIIGLVILGAAFQFQQLSGLIGYLAIGSLAIYVASFAVGLGPVFWLMISEIYPLKARGAAMSVATAANWGMNLTVALTFLTLLGALVIRRNSCRRLGLFLSAGA